MIKKIVFLLICLPMFVSAQTLTVTGSPWVVTLSYPFSDVMSPDPQILISFDTPKNADWVVTVSRDDLSWSNDLTLSVRRTGDGTGHPHSVPQGGTSWVEITTGSTVFFTGTKRGRDDVPCQYLLSPNWPAAGSYSTTVTYTVTVL